jgi:hypothetical protein
MARKPKKDLKMSNADEQDERFKHVAYDARFQRFPSRNKNKVKVDDRFQRMFTDEEFRVGASKDKRGRKGKDKKDEVRRYYRLEDDEDEDEDGGDGGDGGKLPAASADEELDEHTLRALRMRGLAGSSSSESDEDGDGDGDEDDESDSGSEKSDLDVDNELAEGVLDENIAELYDEWGVGAYAANPNEDVPMLEDATKRLACLDMDWGNVKAVDILAVLRSFVPDGGRIRSVTVYPSDYGLDKMEEEKAAGPRQIYTREAGGKRGAGGVGEGADEDEDALDESDDGSGGDDIQAENDGGALDEARLRYYERSKLRWYYAIVVCSNVKTAEAIYTECDGMEYMKTANLFDLRFVPDDQSFEGRQVRDSATDVPNDYVAPVFQTKALQHTNVELTWDKVDGERKKTLSRKLNADDLKDEDFVTYLASASEDEELEQDDLVPDGDPGAVRKRYQDLLQKSDAGAATERRGKKGWGVEEDSDGEGRGPEDGEDGDKEGNGLASSGCVPDKDMELQVTFEQDLEVLGEKLATKAKERKSGKGAETVWDAYVRRKKEKKEEARRKGKVNYHSSDDDYEDDFDSDIEEAQEPVSPPKNGKGGEADDPFDDPFFSSNDTFKDPSDPSMRKRKKSKKGTDGGSDEDDEVRRRRKAELEMLIMDDALTGKRRKTKSSDRDESVDGTISQKKLSKRERMKLAKLKKRSEREDGSDNEDLEAANREYLDMKDPRFQEIFENPEFALDPTDPRFAKAGAGASKLASEAARRRSRAKTSGKARTAPIADAEDGEEAKGLGKRGKADLKLMVASLKRKQAGAAASLKKGKNW